MQDQSSYQQALAHYEGGQFDQALKALAPLLEQDAVDAEVLNTAAICALKLNREEEAEALWQKALRAEPNSVGVYSNYAILLSRQGKYEAAQLAYERALSINPTFVEAQFNLALLFVRQKRWHEAEIELSRALALRDDIADIHFHRGAALEALGRPQEAAGSYERAYALCPQNVSALLERAKIELALVKWDRAEQAYGEAVARLPDVGWLRFRLGLALEQQHKLDDAEAAYREAIALSPELAEAHNNLGNVQLRLRRFTDALRSLEAAARLRPNDATVQSNLAGVMVDLERLQEAEALYRKALTLDPEHATARFHLSLLLLSQGRYTEGWPMHEVRFDPRLPGETACLPTVEYPQWQGESLLGKSIVVLVEQGLGDGVQFSRYFPLIAMRGASKLTVVCARPLMRLFQQMESVSECIGVEAFHRLPPHDFWCFSMSLPLRFETTLDTIPRTMPYLRPLAKDVPRWKRRMPAGRPRVGLVWAGDPRLHSPPMTEVDRRRSIRARSFLPLLNVAGIEFVSLQKGEASRAQLAELPDDRRPFDPMDSVDDFADTAAIVSLLDLVIAVDTSVAHLAGALNKPVWILSRFDACWRWLRDRDDSPWYPSARLFRQKQPGEWDEVIQRVAHELREWAACSH
ncbi:tetratricopeptide repeat protein [Caballeronia sp. M1242]|uniref:tetratricopeptide repeat protein n=1 Tax=Caballeronia sp. M1242 TaxID=2814653 RepID=UPI0019D264FF|nr:tetratricopeptide repeat protein [Caballeronia sp. M1242]QSN61704.1 tetratricopeptide repeat protein [Caballeronia sp. M1242]